MSEGAIRLGLCQTDVKWEDKEYNANQAESYCRQARERGLDAIFFPEMSFTGFSMDWVKVGEAREETVRRMSECALRYRMAIGFGWVRNLGNKAENHYTVVGEDGTVRSDYVKLHPFRIGGEGEDFICGTKAATFFLSGHTFSTFICYDLRFPEPFAAAAQKADVMVVAANWPSSRRKHWDCLLRARAIENQAYVLGINRVGAGGGLTYLGESVGIDPYGEPMNVVNQKEGLVICEVKGEAAKWRGEFPVAKDRRPELYQTLWREGTKDDEDED